MREILFKAKRKDNEEWIEGIPVDVTPLVCFSTDLVEKEVLMVRAGFADWGMPRGIEEAEVDPNTVCQHIGKKDKNGVRAFECDKVYDPNENRIFVIKWDKELASFVLLDENGWVNKEITKLSYCEVIGNIHDKE